MHVLDNGICVTCRASRTEASRTFDPALHPHDPHSGEFVHTPGAKVAKLLKGLTGQPALDAAPVKLGRWGFDRGDNPADPDALRFYSGHGYIQINALLRSGRSLSGDGKSEWTVHQIDTAMDHSRLTHDVQVHRGVGDLRMLGEHTGSLVGLEYVDRAYASTTADPNVAREMWGNDQRGAILNIHVPAGVKAVQLSELGRKSRHRPPEQEAEMLLDRGLIYRVLGDRVVKGVRQLDVEVVA